MEKIIKDILGWEEDDIQKQSLVPKMPTECSAKDVKILDEAIKQYMGRRVPANVFRLMLAYYYNEKGDPRALGYVLDVNFPQIEKTGFIDEAKVIISEVLIKNDQQMRAHTIQKYVESLEKIKSIEKNMVMKGRIQAIKAGLFLLKSNFYQASLFYLNASRQTYFLEREDERLMLIQIAIAMAFISEKTTDLHKLVCTLYIHDLANKAQCYPLLKKLYSEKMVDQKDLEIVRKYLPKRVDDKDSDNISIMQKAIFSHNMLAIFKCFSRISLQTLSKMIEIGEDEMLLMIEKTYRGGEVKIDQLKGYLEVKEEEKAGEVMTKKWFDRVDELLAE